MNEDDEEMLATLRYFWENKGDITCSVDFDREKVAKRFPEIIKAWDDYKTAERMLSAVIRGAQ